MRLETELRNYNVKCLDFGDYEIINKMEISNGVKIIAKNAKKGITIGITIVKKSPESFLKSRVAELQFSETGVPDPYTGEINKQKGLDEFQIKFFEERFKHAVGYADAEYRKIIYSPRQLIRFRYFVAWLQTRNCLIEIESYVPTEKFKLEEWKDLAEKLQTVNS